MEGDFTECSLMSLWRVTVAQERQYGPSWTYNGLDSGTGAYLCSTALQVHSSSFYPLHCQPKVFRGQEVGQLPESLTFHMFIREVDVAIDGMKQQLCNRLQKGNLMYLEEKGTQKALLCKLQVRRFPNLGFQFPA